jgi:hypothetical protein
MDIKPIEVIDVLALLIAIAALVVAIVGIREVRQQVKMLITMERNRTFTKVLEKFTRVFVDITDEGVRPEITQLKRECIMLARAVDDNVTFESSMSETSKEVLSNAAALAKAGLAQWKPEMDLETVAKILRDWQAEKFVGTMFGNKPRST